MHVVVVGAPFDAYGTGQHCLRLGTGCGGREVVVIHRNETFGNIVVLWVLIARVEGALGDAPAERTVFYQAADRFRAGTDLPVRVVPVVDILLPHALDVGLAAVADVIRAVGEDVPGGVHQDDTAGQGNECAIALGQVAVLRGQHVGDGTPRLDVVEE